MARDKKGEARTVALMIDIYCRGRHGGAAPCPDCAALRDYAFKRLELCPYEPKPACKDCRTHCYQPAMRARVREVMAYAGRRMPLRHPVEFLRHLFGL